MIYVVICLVLVVAILIIALVFQIKKSNQQAAESQGLLNDYQRRVDELQALSTNFDNVGAGYEQALLMYDKMEEEKQMLGNSNAKLEKSIQALQEERNRSTESLLKKQEWIQKYTEVIKQELSNGGANIEKINKAVNSIQNINDAGVEVALECHDNVLITDIIADAIKETGIDKSNFVKFDYMVAEDTLATMVLTNKQQAVRVLANMLDNAMKFTTDGSAKLMVSTVGSIIEFSVENSGSGIPSDEAEHIFEPFVKLNSYFDGAGIGLTIARSIARRLKGDVVLDTEYADGTRFVFSLPI